MWASAQNEAVQYSPLPNTLQNDSVGEVEQVLEEVRRKTSPLEVHHNVSPTQWQGMWCDP
jgi:hypothetical protein